MFGLNIADHVRLNWTRTGKNYTVHARAAERLAGLTSLIRIGVLALILIDGQADQFLVSSMPSHHDAK